VLKKLLIAVNLVFLVFIGIAFFAFRGILFPSSITTSSAYPEYQVDVADRAGLNKYLDSISFWKTGNVLRSTAKSLSVELVDQPMQRPQGKYFDKNTNIVYASWIGEMKNGIVHLRIYLDRDNVTAANPNWLFNAILVKSLYKFTGSYNGRVDDPTLVKIEDTYEKSPNSYLRITPKKKGLFSKLVSWLVPEVYAACTGNGYQCGTDGTYYNCVGGVKNGKSCTSDLNCPGGTCKGTPACIDPGDMVPCPGTATCGNLCGSYCLYRGECSDCTPGTCVSSGGACYTVLGDCVRDGWNGCASCFLDCPGGCGGKPPGPIPNPTATSTPPQSTCSITINPGSVVSGTGGTTTVTYSGTAASAQDVRLWIERRDGKQIPCGLSPLLSEGLYGGIYYYQVSGCPASNSQHVIARAFFPKQSPVLVGRLLRSSQ